MSTRCNVCVKIHKEDFNSFLKTGKTNYMVTNEEYPYMDIYIHHDGYISGVGKSLYENLRTYEDVKNFILAGDRITFNTTYVECGDFWEYNRPQLRHDVDFEIPEQYYYLFDEDNEWYYKDNKTNGPWKLLKDEFPEIRDEREDKLKQAIDITDKVFTRTIGFDIGGIVKAMTPEESYEWHKKHARINDNGTMTISDEEIGDGSFEKKYTKWI